jgi:sRNA-binding carbon storage regulator CsrA
LALSRSNPPYQGELMRIFTLAEDEAVAIGEDLVIRVLEVTDDEVRLAIESLEGALIGQGDLVVRLSESARECRAPR